MKYIEFGIGNKWILRTEIEPKEGSEYEEKGIIGPIKIQSLYIRIWLGNSVLILDTKEGFKRRKKDKRCFKFIIGICSLE